MVFEWEPSYSINAWQVYVCMFGCNDFFFKENDFLFFIFYIWIQWKMYVCFFKNRMEKLKKKYLNFKKYFLDENKKEDKMNIKNDLKY